MKRVTGARVPRPKTLSEAARFLEQGQIDQGEYELLTEMICMGVADVAHGIRVRASLDVPENGARLVDERTGKSVNIVIESAPGDICGERRGGTYGVLADGSRCPGCRGCS